MNETTWKYGDRFTCAGNQRGTIIGSQPDKKMGWRVRLDGELYARHMQEWLLRAAATGDTNA